MRGRWQRRRITAAALAAAAVGVAGAGGSDAPAAERAPAAWLLASNGCRVDPEPLEATVASLFDATAAARGPAGATVVSCPSDARDVQLTFLNGPSYERAFVVGGGGGEAAAVPADTALPEADLAVSLSRKDVVGGEDPYAHASNVLVCPVVRTAAATAGALDAAKCVPVPVLVEFDSDEDPVVSSLQILPSDSANCAGCGAFDPRKEVYDVELFANVPVEIAVRGSYSRQVFVDRSTADAGADAHFRPSAGLTDHTRLFSYRPPAEVGATENVTVISANVDRSRVRKYVIRVKTIASGDPRIAKLSISPGRLDPEFRPDTFSYNARVAEGTGCFTVALDAVDDRNTACLVHAADDPAEDATEIRGGGSARVCFGARSNVISVSCEAADGNHRARYVLTAVEQRGGSTLLQSLDVVGGTFNHEFDPEVHGIYRVDLDLQRVPNQEFVSFRAVPRNERAIVTVNEAPVKNTYSPWFRVPKGAQKHFIIAVKTPENDVEERYHAVVDRRGHWYERNRYARGMANFFSVASLFASSDSSPAFLNNLRTLQFFAVTNKIHAKPEAYDAFSEGFDKWNFQSNRPPHWLLNPKEPREYYDIVYLPATPYGGSEDSSDEAPTTTEAPATTTTTTTEKTTTTTEATTTAKATKAAAPATTAPDAGDAEWASALAAAPAWFGVGGHGPPPPPPPRGDKPPPPRRLIALDTDDQLRLIVLVNAAYKQRTALLAYMAGIVVITLGLILTGVIYAGAAYYFVQKGVRSKDDRVRDTPKILHPLRFWTFVFDAVLIGYSQCAFGILGAVASDLRDTKFYLFGWIPVTPRGLIWLAVLALLMFPTVYLALVAWVLRSLHSSTVYSRELGFYHKRSILVAKAETRCCRWLPFLSNLLSIEVRDVAPLHAVDNSEGGKNRFIIDDASGRVEPQPLTFQHEQRTGGPCSMRLPAFGGNNDNISNAEISMPLKTRDSNSLPSKPLSTHYHQDARELKVSFADIHRSHVHDTANAELYAKHADAMVGRRAVRFLNPYGEPVDCHTEVQMKHLSNIWQMGEVAHQLAFWIPTKNCQLLDFDGWFNFFHLSHRGMFFYYLADRVVAVAALLLITLWAEADGVTTMVLLICTTLLLMGVYTPAAVNSGTAAWYRHMEKELRREIKLRTLLEKEQIRQSRWPFSTSRDLELKVQQLQKKREAADACGSGGWCLRHNMDGDCGVNSLAFWDTRLFFVMKYFITGAPGSEMFKCLVLTSVALGSPACGSVLSNGFASTLAFIFACCALIAANYASFKYILRVQIPEFTSAVRRSFRRLCVWAVEMFGDSSNLSGRFRHTFETIGARLRGRQQPSFDYPGMAGHRIREQRVSEGFIVFEEVGMHMRGPLRATPETELRKRIVASHEKVMFSGKLTKTFYQAGPLGASRPVDEVMPIRLPFRSLYHGKMTRPMPVAATVHVVNHGFRSVLKDPAMKECFGMEDDSYLSLFRDPRFLPEWGQIVPPAGGHGYALQYDAASRTLTIRGPSIRAREEYNVYSVDRPAGADDVDDPRLPGALNGGGGGGGGNSLREPEIDGPGTRCAVSAVCASSGSLYISVPPGKPPCLFSPIEVTGPGGNTFVIDPLETKVYYEPVSQELVLRHRQILSAHDAETAAHALMTPPARGATDSAGGAAGTIYDVAWTVAGGGQRLDEFAVAQDEGVLHVKLPIGAGVPDLDRCLLVLRQTRDGTKISVDPRHSDAHRIPFPVPPTPGGIPFWRMRAWYAAAMRGVRSSDEEQRDRVEDAVPCTIVQCVNPQLGLYRVEPNFREVMRALRAQLHHFEAQHAQLSEPWCLATCWHLVMSPAEFWRFWKSQGIDIVPAQGLWVNPLVDVSEPLIRRQQREIEAATPAFRARVERLFEAQTSELKYRLRYVADWVRAYDDPALYAAQLAKDAAEQRGAADLDRYMTVLRETSSQYRSKIGAAFVYPLIVAEHRLSLRPNYGAQIRLWKQQLAVWLRAEEDAPLLTPLRGSVEPTSLEKVVMEVMHAVKSNLNAAEEPLLGRPLTALHYCVDSLSVRGPFTNWRPDPIGGHLAAVRLWPRGPDGEPDFAAEPVWNPCCLKLTASAVKILLPAKDDAEYDFGNAYYWSHVFGYSVQLDCLDGLTVSVEGGLPAGAASNALLEGQRGQLKCWLTAALPHVDDRQIRLVENGKSNREVNINPSGGGGAGGSSAGGALPSARSSANGAAAGDDSGNAVAGPSSGAQSAGGVLLVSLGKRLDSREAGFLPAGEARIAANAGPGGFDAQAYPLTFRFNERFVAKWRAIIEAAQMDRPPLEVDEQFGLNSPLDTTDREEPTPPPPPPPTPPPPPPAQVYEEPVVPAYEAPPPPPAPEPELPAAELTDAEAKVQYAGDWQNYRYHGVGTLRDLDGNEIYSGEWREGRRWGRGRCQFRDSSGALWQYEGEFRNDDFCGKGRATLVDQDRLARLQREQDPAVLRNTVVAFTGDFRPPRGNRRRHSNCYTERPRLPPAALQQLFEQDPALRNGENLVIDIRKTASLDVERADGASDEQSTTSSFVEAARENYMPHRGRWLLRAPHIPQESLQTRFATGVAQYADGSVYQGQFNARNEPHGVGRYMTGDGSYRIEGTFRDGRPDGHVAATSRSARGDEVSFFGTMRGGVREGEAIVSSDKVYMEAVFEKDRLAPGTAVDFHHLSRPDDRSAKSPDAVVSFSGPLRDGALHGEKCTVKWQDGSTYTGGVENGLRHGQGVVKDPSGRVVVAATWQNDVPHGRASRIVLPDGKVYSGEMNLGKRHGLGEMYLTEKSEPFYEGMWADDVPEGRGTLYAPDGVYDGEYRRGKRCGKGTFEFAQNPLPNGSLRTYTGDWRNDVPDGVGMYKNELGVENTYKFENGQLNKTSLKAYKSGMCGSAPTIGVAPQVSAVPFTPVASPWYGSNKSLISRKISTADAEAMGAALSYNQRTAQAAFVPLDQAPKEAVRPRLTPPPRPGSEEEHQLLQQQRKGETGSGHRGRHEREKHARQEGHGGEKPATATVPTIKIPHERSPIRPPYLYVYIDRAKDLPNMDMAHEMDPYVVLRLGEHKRQTKVQKRAGTNPKFGEEFFLPLDEEDRVIFEVFDKDTLKSDDFVARADFAIASQPFEGRIPLYRAEKKQGSVKAGYIYVSIGCMQ